MNIEQGVGGISNIEQGMTILEGKNPSTIYHLSYSFYQNFNTRRFKVLRTLGGLLNFQCLGHNDGRMFRCSLNTIGNLMAA